MRHVFVLIRSELSAHLHNFDESDHEFFAYFCVWLGKNDGSNPIRHVVKMFREFRQIRTQFFRLLFRPQQHFRQLDLLKKFWKAIGEEKKTTCQKFDTIC